MRWCYDVSHNDLQTVDSISVDSVCLIRLPFDISLLIINSFSLSVLHTLSKHLQRFDSCCQRELKCQQQLEISRKSITLLYSSVCHCCDGWEADPLTFSVIPLSALLTELGLKPVQTDRVSCSRAAAAVQRDLSMSQHVVFQRVCYLLPDNTSVLQREAPGVINHVSLFKWIELSL